MTRVDISPEQLDAEAAAPVRDLDHLIYWHRLLFRDDIWIRRLHPGSDHGKHSKGLPAGDEGGIEGVGMAAVGAMSGWTGLPFSVPFGRYVSGVTEDDDHHREAERELGAIFPWTRSYVAMRQRHCRQTHYEHTQREEWRGSLCAELVNLTVRHAYSFDAACYELFVTPERTRSNLAGALTWIERHMDALRQRQQPRDSAKERWGFELSRELQNPERCLTVLRGHGWSVPRSLTVLVGELVKDGSTVAAQQAILAFLNKPEAVTVPRHDQPGLHRSDCPKCRRRGAA